jgi:pimeloyl-ACP methyl ester carboxylesterase
VTAASTHVEVAGATLAVREWGEPDGRPILLWHALGPVMSAALYGELEPALRSTAFRLIAPDAPGFGASPELAPEQYEIAALVDLLWELADELGLERPGLAGHSWGGVVACAAAAAEPQRTGGLVLLDSGHRDYQDDPSFGEDKTLADWTAEAAARRLRLPGWDALWHELEEGAHRPLTPALREAIAAGVREEDGAVVGIATPEAHGAALHGLAGFRVSETWPGIGRAGIRVLLLLATEPPELRAQNEAALPRVREAIPLLEAVLVDDAGHSLLTDAGPAIAETLAGWLRRL